MGLIFYFSAQPRGSAVLENFPLPGAVGHLVGYAVLALLVYRAFSGGVFGWHTGTAIKTFSLCLLYAISDELHQRYVLGREGLLLDVLIDGSGVLLALLFLRLLPQAAKKSAKKT